MTGARNALFLLLAVNLFNYIDRQVLAALEPDIRASFFAPNDVNAMTKTGLLGVAFFVTYMVSAPILGLLADRFSRWIIIGCAVILWSLASGGSGLAATFGILFATRVCVGIGEGGYGPAAPTFLSDLFPIETRGRIKAILRSDSSWQRAGYVIGGLIGVISAGAHLFPKPRQGCFGSPVLGNATARRSGSSIQKSPPASALPEFIPHTFLPHQLHRDDTDDFCSRRPGIFGPRLSSFRIKVQR